MLETKIDIDTLFITEVYFYYRKKIEGVQDILAHTQYMVLIK